MYHYSKAHIEERKEIILHLDTFIITLTTRQQNVMNMIYIHLFRDTVCPLFDEINSCCDNNPTVYPRETISGRGETYNKFSQSLS